MGLVAARLQGLRVRIQPGSRMSLNSECCVLSSRGLCAGLITRREESYECGVSESDQGTSQSRRGGQGSLGVWTVIKEVTDC